MQGFNLNGRPIRVSLATARRSGVGGGAAALANAAPHPADLDPTNTTLFIGGLSGGVTEDQLRAVFGQYGEIVYTKVPAGKGVRACVSVCCACVSQRESDSALAWLL